MLFSKFSIFKSRQPKQFTYVPRYYNEEAEMDQNAQDAGSRIRQAYGSMERKEPKKLRDRMEERRLLGSYDGEKARKKTISLLALLAIIVFLYFWMG